jgi:hypothetical protein
MVVSFLLVNGRVLGVVGGWFWRRRAAGWAYLQGCPSVAAVFRRHGSSVGGSHTERHSAVWHLVQARPMN